MSANLFDAASFFFNAAGYSYSKANESERRGHERSAMALARAERWAHGKLRFEWEMDDQDSSSFGDTIDGETYPLFVCTAWNSYGEIAASLGGVGFAHGGTPAAHDSGEYRRVVEAELALCVREERRDLKAKMAAHF